MGILGLPGFTDTTGLFFYDDIKMAVKKSVRVVQLYYKSNLKHKKYTMKKAFIIVALLFAGSFVFGQSDKYVKAMEGKIAMMDSAKSPDEFRDLANAFERIGDAEKNQWLPYYYAAYAHTIIGYSYWTGQPGNLADKIDPEADKAEAMLNKAIALSKETSETWVIKKMIASVRMLGDVMNRFMTDGAKAAEALQKAKELDANNPRIYLLEGEDKFNTPEQYGGSKDEAKILFDKSKALYGTYKPESSIHPNWGLNRLMDYLSKY
jgi:hypothetical protein